MRARMDAMLCWSRTTTPTPYFRPATSPSTQRHLSTRDRPVPAPACPSGGVAHSDRSPCSQRICMVNHVIPSPGRRWPGSRHATLFTARPPGGNGATGKRGGGQALMRRYATSGNP